jgi:hypothetical protein
MGPHRLAWFRTSGFHPENTDSNSVGAAMHPKHQEAINLRLEGKSYTEINNILGIAKSTQSDWFKTLKLPIRVQKILTNKKIATTKNFNEFNKKRTEDIQKENKKIIIGAVKEIKTLSKYELKLLGVALYWGEGYKNQKRNSKYVQISNADPYLIALFLRFLREVIKIPEEKLKVSIFLYPNINISSSISFWSKITNIDSERFRTTVSVSRASRGKRPQNSLPYGTLKLSVNSRRNFYQIKGWINGLIKQSVPD